MEGDARKGGCMEGEEKVEGIGEVDETGEFDERSCQGCDTMGVGDGDENPVDCKIGSTLR